MYLYTAWFRDPRLAADDQDYEWPACFVVEAESADAARAWGDVLAKRRALRRGEVFLSSEAGVADASADSLPRVAHGVEVSDGHIGW